MSKELILKVIYFPQSFAFFRISLQSVFSLLRSLSKQCNDFSFIFAASHLECFSSSSMLARQGKKKHAAMAEDKKKPAHLRFRRAIFCFFVSWRRSQLSRRLSTHPQRKIPFFNSLFQLNMNPSTGIALRAKLWEKGELPRWMSLAAPQRRDKGKSNRRSALNRKRWQLRRASLVELREMNES